MSDTVEGFREILLSHARSPRCSAELANADLVGTCSNPLCGDFVKVSIRLVGDRIDEISAQVNGCTMATASSSLMCELINGKSLSEARNLREQLHSALLRDVGSAWPNEIRSLLPLSRLRESPARVPCALMGWFAFKDALSRREPLRSC